MSLELVEITPTIITIVDVTPTTIEAQNVVSGPAGPQGQAGGVSDAQLETIIESVEADFNSGPDLTILYLNAKV